MAKNMMALSSKLKISSANSQVARAISAWHCIWLQVYLVGSRIGAKFYSVFSSVKSGNAENTADLFGLITSGLKAVKKNRIDCFKREVKTKLNLEQVWLAVLPNRDVQHWCPPKGSQQIFPKQMCKVHGDSVWKKQPILKSCVQLTSILTREQTLLRGSRNRWR